MILLGICIALCSAIFLSLGAQLQHSGVNQGSSDVAKADQGFTLGTLLGLFRRPRWLAGGLVLGVSATLHLVSLGLAPVIVVQPIGIVGLVITTIVYARRSRTRLTRGSLVGLVCCVAGITLFVILAAGIAHEPRITNHTLTQVLLVLLAVFAVIILFIIFLRRHISPLLVIVAGGMLHGFDAILMKAILTRVLDNGFDWLVFACILGLISAFSVGTYFVQLAYSINAPDVVLGGMTVVDPLVAVLVGAVVLREAAGASPLAIAGFILAGFIAILGIYQMIQADLAAKTDTMSGQVAQGR